MTTSSESTAHRSSQGHLEADTFLKVSNIRTFPIEISKFSSNTNQDSLQAFSSSIAGLLASRAVLSSIGIGDETASPTAALMLTIFQESIGRLATILFAHRFGTALEPECKMYRLLADVLNDTGFILDCISPAFPKPLRPIILTFSSVLRALCGVAAGSAKASLSAHFAKWGNLGELNAKDSSQETVISLLGMWAGTLVVSCVTAPLATWTTLILLLSIHLETNRRAVRAVRMRNLNRQRATLVFHHLRRDHIPSLEEISAQERIFERDGVLRATNGRILGSCAVGVPMGRFLASLATVPHPTTKSAHLKDDSLNAVLDLYDHSLYILWHDRAPNPSQKKYFIVLKKGAQPWDMLLAWWQALAWALDADSGSEREKALRARNEAKALLLRYEEKLREKGWDLESGALETRAGRRVVVGR